MNFSISDIEFKKSIGNYVIPNYDHIEAVKPEAHPLADYINRAFILENCKVKDTCVYFHYTADEHKLFYVGIGNEKRPYRKIDRSDFWHKFVKKHDGFAVEIQHDNITWFDACQLEMFYIKKYGRRNNGTGILVNLTDGGDGVKGMVVSKETKLKHSKAVYQCSKNGIIKEHSSLNIASKETGISLYSIGHCVAGIGKSAGGFLFILKTDYTESLFQERLQKWRPRSLWKSGQMRAVIKLDMEFNFIEEYASILDASIKTGIKAPAIGSCARFKTKTAGKFIWIYKSTYEEDLEQRKAQIKTLQKLDENLTVISEYKSILSAVAITSAAIDGGIKRRTDISECLCGNRKTAGGHKWRWK